MSSDMNLQVATCREKVYDGVMGPRGRWRSSDDSSGTEAVTARHNSMYTQYMISKVFLGSGGGKCLTYLGALRALEEDGAVDTSAVTTWGGVSAGAALAAFLSTGMTVAETGEFLSRVSLEKLGEPVEVELLFTKFGLNDGTKAMTFFRAVFHEKLGMEDPTFEDLHRVTSKRLLVQVTNLTTARTEILCHETHPGMSVALALRMSTAMPFVFTPVEHEGCLYVDGALLAPTIHCDDPTTTLSLYVRDSNIVLSDPPQSILDYALWTMRCLIGAAAVHGGTEIAIEGEGMSLFTPNQDGEVLIVPDETMRRALIRMGYEQMKEASSGRDPPSQTTPRGSPPTESRLEAEAPPHRHNTSPRASREPGSAPGPTSEEPASGGHEPVAAAAAGGGVACGAPADDETGPTVMTIVQP